MSEPKSGFLKDFIARGYFHQCTDLEGLDSLARDGHITGYIGFDATADALHVGNLVQIMLLRRLQQHGHRPIVLMGGGTTKVGDPSGRDDSRKLLSAEDIARNIETIGRIFARFLEFGAESQTPIMANNADWLDGLSYIPFLRDYGRHFSVNRMLSFDSVKLRLEREQPLSFLEFNYMVLQAYDFLELARRFDCVLQMGGSDQWGNIVNGVELARRVENRSLFGLTSPLITTSAGAKMGKTAQGAVWLSPDRLSPYEYWQYWRDTADADVDRFLRMFTDLPMEETARLAKLRGAELNAAKIVLATEATALAHGREAAEAAAESARQTFGEGGAGADLPQIEVARADLERGISAVDLLHRSGLAASKGAARRLIKGGGARVNGLAVTDDSLALTLADVTPQGYIKLSAGKKKHALIHPG
jgi:tyrosyl-tRNA synthetase